VAFDKPTWNITARNRLQTKNRSRCRWKRCGFFINPGASLATVRLRRTWSGLHFACDSETKEQLSLNVIISAVRRQNLPRVKKTP